MKCCPQHANKHKIHLHELMEAGSNHNSPALAWHDTTEELQVPASAYDTGSKLQQGQNLTVLAAHVFDPPFPAPGLSMDPLH
jgi:hypothetical protein